MMQDNLFIAGYARYASKRHIYPCFDLNFAPNESILPLCGITAVRLHKFQYEDIISFGQPCKLAELDVMGNNTCKRCRRIWYRLLRKEGKHV